MTVVDDEKGLWFLLQDRDEYYLDVKSGRSFVGYSMWFGLYAEEVDGYQAEGANYISRLARLVNEKQEPYIDRQQGSSREILEAIHGAILEWNVSKRLYKALKHRPLRGLGLRYGALRLHC